MCVKHNLELGVQCAMQNTLKRTHLKGKTNKKEYQRWEIKGGTEQATLLVIQIKVH